MNKYANILIYHGKYGDQYWLVDTPARREAAMRALFNLMDGMGMYDDENERFQTTLAAARGCDAVAIKAILESRNGYEYEQWDIEHAEITE